MARAGQAIPGISLIYRTCRDDCDRQTLLTLYRSLVRPQLEYATQVWSPSGIGNTKLIERVQRRATRFILKSNDDYLSRLQKLGLLPLSYRRELFDLYFFFKCLMGLYDFDVFQWVKFKDFRYRVRNSERRLAKGRFRTDVYKFPYFNRIVDLWNNLPLFIRKCTNYMVFKKECIKHYHRNFLQNVTAFL